MSLRRGIAHVSRVAAVAPEARAGPASGGVYHQPDEGGVRSVGTGTLAENPCTAVAPPRLRRLAPRYRAGMPHEPALRAYLAQLERMGEDPPDLEVVGGVMLLAPRVPPDVARVATALALRLSRVLPDHEVATGVHVAFGDADRFRIDVAVARPFARDDGWALAVFVGSDEGPLRWRAYRCALAGIPEVWTIAPPSGMGSRWRWPDAGRYRRRDPLPPGALVAPEAAPERSFVAWTACES